ncbi:MAG: M23 family metallopeptidase [Chthoniobacterales bacterium]
MLLLLGGCARLGAQESSNAAAIALPTDNDAIFHGGGPEFYQYITRDFKGVKSTPWEGGQYGFVRDPVETPGGLVYSRFHEGIDIRPMRRDASGEPLDEVRAIADGEVVYVNLVPGYSNYGNYVVVEHRWDGGNYYSLYGHLASIAVRAGSKVTKGQRLGIMGHTGTGLDRERAHLHLELNLLLSRHFDAWYDHFVKNDPNRHGLYNGINLAGIDIAKFYLAQHAQPDLSVPRFLEKEHTFYQVTLPATKKPELTERYPWLLRKTADTTPPSWEISFNRAGVPLKVAPGKTAVAQPIVSFVEKQAWNYSDLTRGIITGRGKGAHLSESGARLMQLLIWPD